jgi:CheY-like chemotaxis protein
MEKAESLIRDPRHLSRARPDAKKSRKKPARPKVNMALDRAGVSKMIDQIREEVEFHHGCAAALKAQLERLTSTTFDEILKVKELKKIIEKLKENTDHRDDSPPAPQSAEEGTHPSRPKEESERWKIELDRELEKLLIIKKLLEVSLPPPAAKEEPPVLPASNGTKKILVVDDDLTSIKIISHFLQKENFRVSTSLSGVDGLKKAFEENPDLILLDVMMPDLNGFQFLSIYRKDEENARTPVVILSSLSEEADVLKGLKIGAVDYITKPFSPQVLIAKIKKNIPSRP